MERRSTDFRAERGLYPPRFVACPIRVLYLSPLPPPPGGIESWTAHVLEVAGSHGIDTRVIDTRSPQPDRSPAFALYKLRYGLSLLRRCARACAEGDLDLVHLNCSFRRWSAARDYAYLCIAHARGLPVVVHLRGGLAGGREWRTFPRVARHFYRRLLEEADAVIVLADEVARDLESAGIRPRRCVQIPNFLPPGWTEASTPTDTTPRGARVLFTGRLMPEKGTRALVALAERLPELEFHWAGRQTVPLRVPPNVTWHGENNAEELRLLYAGAGIFLFPTDYPEGFPNSVLEAMAAGLPIVSTQRGAIPEMVVHGEGGFVHPPGDHEGMARSLEKLAADPGLRVRMGEANRERVRRAYTAERVLPQLRRLYGELSGTRGRADDGAG